MTTIYHNPRCSKSRQTLALLRERGIEPEIIEYLVTPPNAERLKELLAMMGKSPRDILRRKEAAVAGAVVDSSATMGSHRVRASGNAPEMPSNQHLTSLWPI